jgi:SAM-dependent methyltransferase
MAIDATKLFSAERQKNLYPISARNYFNKTRVSRLNLSTMKSIIDTNVKSPVNDDLNILDWGCGNLLWALALFPGSFITGVDKSKDNLSYSKINAKKNNSEFKGLLFDRDIQEMKEASFDHSMAFGLIELIPEEMFKLIFSKIYALLKPGGKLFITHYNYRPISSVYLPWLIRGGYDVYKKYMGMDIQKKRTKEVINDFKNIGYICIDSGGICPYPMKIWPLVFSDKGYITRNSLIKEWYYTQFIVLQKPYK